MIKPPCLVKGDCVGMVAPAGIVKRDEIEHAIVELESWGLEVISGEHLYDSYRFFAGTDDHRLKDLQTMLDSPYLKAIFCARGGYGTVRLLGKLTFDGLIKYPKWVVGFSDITLLHSAINRQCNMESLHAAMPNGFHKAANDGKTLPLLKYFLFNGEIVYSFPAEAINLDNAVTAVLTGGNLSILCGLPDTPWAPVTDGKILFIEEIGEYLYRFERMLYQLKYSGQLTKIRALVCGHFTTMKDTTPSYGSDAREIVIETVREFGIPIITGFPAGHDFPNLPLVMGREVTLTIKGSSCSVEFAAR